MTTIRTGGPACGGEGHRGADRGAVPPLRRAEASHFLLKSGKHRSDTSRSSLCSRIPPPRASCAASGRAPPQRGRGAGGGSRRRPTTGGIVLAFETGRQLGVRAIFAEEVKDAGRLDAA